MKSFSNLILVVAILLCLALVAVMSWSFYHQETRSIVAQFRNDVDDKIAAIELEIDIDFEAVYAMRGLFNTIPNVSDGEFQSMAREVLRRHKEIQALEWVPRISEVQRPEFVTQRRASFSNFELTEFNDQGLLVPAAKREIYYPVLYVAPMVGNEVALGFDMGSTRVRKIALDKTRDSGRLNVTEPIVLVQEPEEEVGFIVMLPVYDGRATTVVSRRQKLKGFVLSAYRLPGIMRSAIAMTKAEGINLSLYDVSDSEPKLLFEHRSREAVAQDDYHPEFDYTTEIDIGGRSWQVMATPTRGYVAQRHSLTPYLILVLGFFIVVAGALYIRLVLHYSYRTGLLVEERTRELEKARQALERQNRTDPLTGVANRKGFDEALDREWHRAIREQHPLSLLMVDVDAFKQYNDHYGHQAGDNCLKQLAMALTQSFKRSADIVARYGGEEFVVILPNTADAYHLAERCRVNIERLTIPHEYSEAAPVVTVSIGFSVVLPTNDSLQEELLSEADTALYKAKGDGRNRVVRYQLESADPGSS
ncbi:CHASE domain-containing protein [Dongshaea marina]|uniref:CHASE domain-containing protein n=1 Tax=Dongshaea marina TaxID=2047966 RepID=UPI000D3EA4D9|nr:diguanylate cyclase [Dongshaea marina]